MDYVSNYASYMTNLINMVAVYWIELSPIVIAVFITRTIHLLIDLYSPKCQRLRDLVTIFMGFTQVSQYIDKYPNEQAAKKCFITSIVVSYVTYIYIYNKFLNKPPDRSTKFTNYLSGIVTIAPVLINEGLINFLGFTSHLHLRSVVMTLTMKMSSSLIEGPRGELESLAYFLHPASVIFGPWHQQNVEYRSKTSTGISFITTYFRQLRSGLRTLFKSGLILMASQVIADLLYLIEYVDLPETPLFMIQVYFKAQDFRFSHYFMSYLSDSLIVLWHNPLVDRYIICDWVNVEYPRSLVQVVKSWQLPVHSWLKNYVFFPVLKRTSSIPLAILSVYIVSSTLHGFKLHIWAVLLSLGHLTYVEHKLRLHLSIKLSACVLATICNLDGEGKCLRGHRRTSGFLLNCINAFFRLLSMIHLAYLGYIFYGNSDEASFVDALHLWAELYFFSTVVGIASHMILFGIRVCRSRQLE